MLTATGSLSLGKMFLLIVGVIKVHRICLTAKQTNENGKITLGKRMLVVYVWKYNRGLFSLANYRYDSYKRLSIDVLIDGIWIETQVGAFKIFLHYQGIVILTIVVAEYLKI